MSKEKTFIMHSACDGLALSGVYVEPMKELRGVVQLVHGMSEHKERYLDFMEFLASNGYACVMIDHRGHGKSVKSTTDLGYFYDTQGKYIVEDAHQLTLKIKETVQHVPIILFGHSMGSLVVRSYIKSYDNDIDALIVCGSPSRNPMAKLALSLVSVMKKIKGEHHRSKLMQKLAFSSYAKRFQESYSENCWLSSSRRNVEAYDKNPLCGFVFTLNGFENLFHLMTRVYDKQGWSMQHPALPILFVAGEDDPCIDTSEKFKEAYEMLMSCGYQQVEHHLFAHMRHEILNEDEHQQVYDYLLTWIKKLS